MLHCSYNIENRTVEFILLVIFISDNDAAIGDSFGRTHYFVFTQEKELGAGANIRFLVEAADPLPFQECERPNDTPSEAA